HCDTTLSHGTTPNGSRAIQHRYDIAPGSSGQAQGDALDRCGRVVRGEDRDGSAVEATKVHRFLAVGHRSRELDHDRARDHRHPRRDFRLLDLAPRDLEPRDRREDLRPVHGPTVRFAAAYGIAGRRAAPRRVDASAARLLDWSVRLRGANPNYAPRTP